MFRSIIAIAALVACSGALAQEVKYLSGPFAFGLLAELPSRPVVKNIEPLGLLRLWAVQLGMTMDEANRSLADVYMGGSQKRPPNWDCVPLGDAEACTLRFSSSQGQTWALRSRTSAPGNPKWDIESPIGASRRVKHDYLSLIFFEEKVIGIQMTPASFRSEAIAEMANEIAASRTPYSVAEEEMVWQENGILLSASWSKRPKVVLLDGVKWKHTHIEEKEAN